VAFSRGGWHEVASLRRITWRGSMSQLRKTLQLGL
jgi:hypothetical protein